MTVPLIWSFEREQTLRNNWQVISSHYLPATLITSHYLPGARGFVWFVRHRKGLLNWKDHFSQTKECQPCQPHAYQCYVMIGGTHSVRIILEEVHTCISHRKGQRDIHGHYLLQISHRYVLRGKKKKKTQIPFCSVPTKTTLKTYRIQSEHDSRFKSASYNECGSSLPSIITHQ